MQDTHAPQDAGTMEPGAATDPQAQGHPRTRLDAQLFELTREEEELEALLQAQQDAGELQENAEHEAALAIYPWFVQVQEMTRQQALAAETAAKEARERASQILGGLSAEDRAAIEGWVGKRDRMQQAQGAMNAMKRLSTPLHNLDAGLARARRQVSKARHERNRIKSVALEQGVRLSRKLMGRRRGIKGNG